jgi:hypothetical protein
MGFNVVNKFTKISVLKTNSSTDIVYNYWEIIRLIY